MNVGEARDRGGPSDGDEREDAVELRAHPDSAVSGAEPIELREDLLDDLDSDPALAAAVLEIESHIADDGWDQPARLYALVETARLVKHEPKLAAAMGLDSSAAQGSLTPIEQDELPIDVPLEEVLTSIAWPDGVAGCAAVVERLVLPPSADTEIPVDPEAATAFAAEHPDRQEVRMVAGVTRAGATYCALRLRAHDDQQSVVGGSELVPALLELLRATFDDTGDDAGDDPGNRADEDGKTR